MVKTGATFQQAADEYLRYIEEDRARKPSTVAGYRALVRAQLLPAFGKLPVESITTPVVESWIAALEPVVAASEQDAAIYLTAAFSGLRRGELIALDIRRVQEWMGHADVKTTMRYLHHAPRKDDAALAASVFDA